MSGADKACRASAWREPPSGRARFKRASSVLRRERPDRLASQSTKVHSIDFIASTSTDLIALEG